jgi:hypothetical protein
MKGLRIATFCAWAGPAQCEVTAEALTIGLYQEACLQSDYNFLTNDLVSPISGAARSSQLDRTLLDEEAIYGASWEMALGGTPVWLATQVLASDNFVIGECKVIILLKPDETALTDAFAQMFPTNNPITDEINRGARFLTYKVDYDNMVFAAYVTITRVDEGSVTLVSSRVIAEIVQR